MNSLVSEFHVRPDEVKLNDYDVFSDKDVLEQLKDALLDEILDTDLKIVNKDVIASKLDGITSNMNLSAVERNYLFNLVDSEINGYGPIDEIINDIGVKNIMVNSPSEVYIETNEGVFLDKSVSFINDNHILRTIEKIVSNNGYEFNKDIPYLDIQLKNHAKLEVILPPISVRPIFTIKKFNASIASINELIRMGTVTPYMGRFLEACVLGKFNILVCGPSQSGKSNLLNSLANLVNDNDRVICIDNDNSMDLDNDNIIKLNFNNNYNIFDITKNLLPNEVVVSNLDDDNLLNAIMFMNNYKGVLTSTLSCNLDVMNEMYRNIMLNNPSLNTDIVKDIINEGIDIVVSLDIVDNRRRVVDISEVTKKGLVSIFKYDKDEFILIDKVPSCYKKLKLKGIDLVDDIFGALKK